VGSVETGAYRGQCSCGAWSGGGYRSHAAAQAAWIDHLHTPDDVERRLAALERDSHPPQPVITAKEFDRVVAQLRREIAAVREPGPF
jgi:hypothetical protein